MKHFFRSRIVLLTATIMLIIATIAPQSPNASGLSSLTIIRDVEIESALYEWTAPIAKAANIDIDSLKIILVQSDQVNAFVAGGQNIFIYTGLIEKTETPDELIGVIAHEIGHIAGGHLTQGRRAIKRASYESILGTVLGIGAAIVTGDGRLATAVTLGAQNIAASNYLRHSRTNESSADQAALSFLSKAKQSPKGLISFFEKLQDQELLPTSQQNEYMRTHPVTSRRIEAIERKASTSPYANSQTPKAWQEQHARMKAKLLSFIRPQHVPWTYHDDDTSFSAKYARTIASYKNSQTEQALNQIDNLIKKEPKNPYLWELKAQMLTDFSRINEALPPLRKMVELAPNASLFHAMLGHGLIEQAQGQPKNKETLLKQAIKHLHIALQSEPNSTKNRRLLATAYGRLNMQNLADLQLAEAALLKRNYRRAQQLATKVLKAVNPSSKIALHAKDILDFIQKNKPKTNKRK